MSLSAEAGHSGGAQNGNAPVTGSITENIVANEFLVEMRSLYIETN